VAAEQIADDWVIAAGLLFGGACLGMGACVRLGGCRRLLRSYFTASLPPHLRHGVLASLPGGVFFVLGALGVQAIERYGAAALGLIAGLFAGAGVALLLAIWVLISPPGWSKPAWLQTRERNGVRFTHDGLTPISTRQYLVGWAALPVLALVWVVLDLPLAPLLLGLGAGASVLIASRPGAAVGIDGEPSRSTERQAHESRARAERARGGGPGH